jgi:hypothetical protein
MKVHILQHVPFEDMGSLSRWLKNHNAEVSYTRFYEYSELPELEGLDLIIVMVVQ